MALQVNMTAQGRTQCLCDSSKDILTRTQPSLQLTFRSKGPLKQQRQRRGGQTLIRASQEAKEAEDMKKVRCSLGILIARCHVGYRMVMSRTQARACICTKSHRLHYRSISAAAALRKPWTASRGRHFWIQALCRGVGWKTSHGRVYLLYRGEHCPSHTEISFILSSFVR